MQSYWHWPCDLEKDKQQAWPLVTTMIVPGDSGGKEGQQQHMKATDLQRGLEPIPSKVNSKGIHKELTLYTHTHTLGTGAIELLTFLQTLAHFSPGGAFFLNKLSLLRLLCTCPCACRFFSQETRTWKSQ